MNATMLKPIGMVLILALATGCDRVEPGPVANSAGRAPDTIVAVGYLANRGYSDIDDLPPRPTPAYSTEVAPIIEQYCLTCHDNAAAEGGIVLDQFRDEVPDLKHRPLLLRVADALRSESMPPEGEPRAEPEARGILDAWLDAALGPDDHTRGQVTVRRLNRAEYNNTIRDLIGLDLRPADEFPADDIGYGFDNIGDVLATPPILVEMYLTSAETVIGAAFRSPEVRARIMTPPANTHPTGLPAVHAAGPHATRKQGPPDYQRRRPDPDLKRQQRIYDILRGFADRAFRRPATHDELMRLLGIVLSAEKDGEIEESAIQRGLQAVLVSPHFLFRVEPDHERRLIGHRACRITISTSPRGSLTSCGAACPTKNYSDWRLGRRSVVEKTFRPRLYGCFAIPGRTRWPRTSPVSGSRLASSRNSRPTRSSSPSSTNR